MSVVEPFFLVGKLIGVYSLDFDQVVLGFISCEGPLFGHSPMTFEK